jgi:hypothetical protein
VEARTASGAAAAVPGVTRVARASRDNTG